MLHEIKKHCNEDIDIEELGNRIYVCEKHFQKNNLVQSNKIFFFNFYSRCVKLNFCAVLIRLALIMEAM